MTVSIEWYDEAHSVLYMKFESGWTLEDLRLASESGWKMMGTVDHAVGTIMDVSGGNQVPSGFLPYARRLVSARPANAGMIVITGGTSLMMGIYRMLRQLYGVINPNFNVRFARTVNEAYEQFVPVQ